MVSELGRGIKKVVPHQRPTVPGAPFYSPHLFQRSFSFFSNFWQLFRPSLASQLQWPFQLAKPLFNLLVANLSIPGNRLLSQPFMHTPRTWSLLRQTSTKQHLFRCVWHYFWLQLWCLGRPPNAIQPSKFHPDLSSFTSTLFVNRWFRYCLVCNFGQCAVHFLRILHFWFMSL